MEKNNKLSQIIKQKIAEQNKKTAKKVVFVTKKLSAFEQELTKKGWDVLVKPVIRNVGQELKYKGKFPEVYVSAEKTKSSFVVNAKTKAITEITAKQSLEELKKIARDFEVVDQDKKGGIIAFSTDVNSVQLSENKIINWLKQKLTTLKNRFMKNKMLINIIKRHEENIGFTIGNFVHGNYKDKEGNVYNEKSLTIEIINIDQKVLYDIAEEICKEFNQESVLVKDYVSGNFSFLYQ